MKKDDPFKVVFPLIILSNIIEVAQVRSLIPSLNAEAFDKPKVIL